MIWLEELEKVIRAIGFSSSLFFCLNPRTVYSTSLAVCTIINVGSEDILGFLNTTFPFNDFLIFDSNPSSLDETAQLSSSRLKMPTRLSSISFITSLLSSNVI